MIQSTPGDRNVVVSTYLSVAEMYNWVAFDP